MYICVLTYPAKVYPMTCCDLLVTSCMSKCSCEVKKNIAGQVSPGGAPISLGGLGGYIYSIIHIYIYTHIIYSHMYLSKISIYDYR